MALVSQHYFFQTREKDLWFALIARYHPKSKLKMHFPRQVPVQIENVSPTIKAMTEAYESVSDYASLKMIQVFIQGNAGITFNLLFPTVPDSRTLPYQPSQSLDDIIAVFKQRQRNRDYAGIYTKSITVPSAMILPYAIAAMIAVRATSFFYSPSSKSAFVPVTDTHCCYFNTRTVSDLPQGCIRADLEDGLIYTDVAFRIPEEMHDDFERWVENGRNPTEAIFKLRLPVE